MYGGNMNTDKKLQLVAFQGEEHFSEHFGSLEGNKMLASFLDADLFTIIDPKNPKIVIWGERESPDYIEWEEVIVQ